MSEQENYAALLGKVERAILDTKNQGIEIKPLEGVFSELKRHTENIEKVEDNIVAVREEVIEPIKEQLDENKKAGKFSVYGFYAGGIGIILSVFSVLYTSLSLDRVESGQKQSTDLTYSVPRLVYQKKPQNGNVQQDTVGLLLSKTISELDSERKGSVAKLVKVLEDDPNINQENILLFYLENLPRMKEIKNGNGIWNAAVVLSRLEESVLRKEKERIEKFYQKIYNQPGWEQTSKKYEKIAYKAGISLKKDKPNSITRIIDDLF